MKCISKERCYIGEGPIWNVKEKRLYHVNPLEKEIHIIDIESCKVKKIKCPIKVTSLAFDADGRMYVATSEGVFYFKDLKTLEPIYDTEKYSISGANDMKAGPDGRLYVGTQSGKRRGISDEIDGKLYSIDGSGNVKILLDNLILSNGLDWSPGGKRFYHTDSATNFIKEYYFDNGSICYTGRKVQVIGVDGLTVDRRGNIIAACWGKSALAVINPNEFEITNYIQVPTEAPASCAFAGDNMNSLVVVTASYAIDIEKDKNAGLTFLCKREFGGMRPYFFKRSTKCR